MSSDLKVGRWRLLELPSVAEPRGNLTFIQAEQHVPFRIERVYYISAVPAGSKITTPVPLGKGVRSANNPSSIRWASVAEAPRCCPDAGCLDVVCPRAGRVHDNGRGEALALFAGECPQACRVLEAGYTRT